MARVVQRRTSPPYLTIALAFLTVAFAAAFIVVTLKYDDPRTVLAAEQLKWKPIATVDDRDKAPVQPEGTTLVSTLQKQIQDLTQIITGYPNTAFKDTQTTSEKAKREIADASRGTGFIPLLQQVQAEKQALQAQLTEAKSQVDQARAAQTAAVTAQQAAADAYKAQEAALAAKVDAANKAGEKIQADYEAQINALKEENKKAMEGLNNDIAKSGSQLAAAEKKCKDWEMRYKILEKQFRDYVKPPFDPERPLVLHKGKIAEVVDQVAYIDRGSKDRITPGMTFAVFAPGNIAADAKPKATLTVVNVNANSSECKIKDAKPTNPVLSGDVLTNPVFDPQRVYTFVVMGDFDLHLTGKPSRQGTDEVKDMIRRSGGKVVDEITIRTDYLVMGDEPARPAALPAEHSAQDEELNAAQMKAYDEYQLVKKKAAELSVLVLNSNRFLNLMGYTPAKEK